MDRGCRGLKPCKLVSLSVVFIYRNSSGIIGDVLLVATGEENLHESTKHFTRQSLPTTSITDELRYMKIRLK